MATAKERYEEWKKKKEASAEASDPSNMSGAQRHQMYKQQRSSGVRNDIASRLQSFQANYQKIANGYTGRFQSSNGYRSDSGSYLSSLDASRKSLAEEGQAILNLLSQNRTQLDESYVDRVADLIHGAGRGVSSMRMSAKRDNDYWSQWASEDDYKAHVARQEDYDAKKSYDLEKGQAEIDHLQRVLEEYKVRSRTMTDEQGEARLEAIRQQYGDEKAIKALISQKRSYLNQAKHIQDGIALSGVDVNEDFQQNSRYQSTKKANPEWWENGVGDTQYEWINNRDGFREEWEQSQAKLAAMSRASSQSDVYLGPQESPYKQKGYDLLRDHEIAIYNYYYAKEGPDKAQEYLDSIQETLNQRKAKNIYDPMEEQTLLELAFGVAAGLDQFSSGVQALFNTKDDYIPQSAIQMASGMVREDLADNGPKLPDWMGGASLGQVGYDAITTSANMAPSILTSVAANALLPGSGAIVGNTMMFASAAGNAYQEALNYGYDKSQARAYSTLVGASEAGLQYILGGIGALGGKASGGVITKMLSGVDNAFLRTAGKIGGNMLSEGFEEGLQEILTPMFKNFALHADEDINWSEAAYSFLLGALTAGFMEGPTTISNAVSLRNTGKQLKEANISANRLAEIGKTFAADTVAYQLAGRVNENTGAYTMGRLFNEIGATLTEQNVTDITEALIKEGLPSDMAKEKAKQMAQIVAGATLTEEGIRAVEEDTLFARAVKATIIDPNATWYQRTRGYNEALMALAKEKASPAKAAQQSQGNMPASDNVDAQNETGSKAAPEADTAPAKVKKISAINKGVATVMLEDGTEVNVRDADLDPDDGVRIETIANIDGISAADADYILGALRAAPGASAQMDSLGAREAYKYGFYGFSQEHLAKTSVFAGSLTETQRQRIYELGQNARNATVQKETQLIAENATVANSATTGKQVYFDSGNGNVVAFSEAKKTGLSKTQKAGVQAAMVLHKLGIGGDIYFFESYRNSKGQLVYKDKNGIEQKAPNGWYSEKDGSIHIDLNAGTMGQGYVLYTLSHELTHFIEQWSPKKYKALADFLVENYEKGQSMDKLVRAKQAKLSELRGKKISYKEAYSEVVADSMEAMLSDGNVLDKLIALKAKDQGLVNKMKQFFDNLVAKIRSIYKGLTPDSVEGNAVLEMKDSIEKLQQLFADALVEASENFQSAMESVVESGAEAVSENEIITDGAVVTDGEGNKFSIKSMKADIAEGQMFEDLKKYCGWTQKQVNELRKNLEDLVAYMTPFRDVLDMNETYDREGRRFSPYKPNSDPLYKISMDFSTLCSKRLLTQYVIENLQLRENRPMSAEEQMAIRDMLNEYRKVEKGLQVACAMCYVEAARLKSPQQINKWLADPATQMKNYFADKNADFANFIKEKQADFKESRGYDRNATKKDMSAKDVRELNKIRPKLRSQYQLSAEEAKIVERAQALPNSTYLTAGNLAALSETDPTIYAAYTAFVRTATRSKSLETDEPYYYGDSRRDNGNGIIVTDSFIESVNRENGMRFSSWSDWRIQHLLDYITAVIDNSVRGAAMHGYTKFGEEVRVLGKTGMMFNMSGVAGSQTGLNEDGSLSFSPTESIDANEAIQLREEFPDTAGLQCIGVGDDHIVALLRSDIIDYVIPYHVSGLNAALRAMANIHGWKDYTSTQHAAIDKSMKLEDAVDKEHWHEEPFYSEFFVGYDTGMTGIEAMRASADRYIQMCKDRGLKPKFEQFSTEENYWKLLIDRKMINQKTGNLIQQKPVTPTFDFGTIKEVVDRYVKNYDSNMEARALNHIVENWDSIPQRIRDLKKQGGKKAKKASKAVDTLANQTLAAQPVDGKQFSIREQFYKEFDAWDKKNANVSFVTGTTSDALLSIGMKDQDIVLRSGTVLQKLNNHPEMTLDIFKKIPELLEHPIIVQFSDAIDSKTKRPKYDSSITVLGELYADVKEGTETVKKPVLVSLELMPTNQKKTAVLDFAIIKSAYSKNALQQYINENSILYIDPDKKRTDSWLSLNRLQLPLGENRYGPIRKIAYADGKVKVQNPKTMTDMQRKLFEAGKIDEFGNKRFSDRDTESVSNRSLLANALDGVAQNDMERQKMQEYKDKISLIEAEEQKLAKLKEQIRELSFAKGPKDMEKLRALRDEATKTANRINTLDKMLLRLEAAKPLQDVLQREKKKAYDRAKQKGDEALAAYRERATNAQRELMEKWQESRKKGIESREKTAMRHKIQSVVGELNQLLLTNDKKRHVPDSLKKAVADALALVNMDTVGAEERAAKYANLIAKETDPDKIDAYTATMENILRQGEKMGQRLKELRDAYEEIQGSDDPDIANAYDPVIAGALKELAGSIGNTSLRSMTIEQLSDVYDMYRMVLTRVRDANKSFLNEKKDSISNLASRVVGEVRRTGGEHTYRAAALDPVRKFLWNNLKPVYAFEHLGSATLTEAFNSVRKGEDTWAKDVTEAREYYLDKSKKYGYDSWDFKKKHRFESDSGIPFELTLEQILSLYAYSKREQAHDHLRLGGFVFDSNIETYKDGKLVKYKVNTADAHQITPDILAGIIGKLSKEQMDFVDEMQAYLSTTMGAKGNEVTMKMYGVKLFKEKFYFPLKSAKQFMFEQNEVSGEVRIKNSGFTNKTVAKANNPVILSNFMDVWSGHVNDMSMYHAFVLPLEDFNRIFNYNSPKREGQPPVSVKGTIQSAYSPAAVSYVKNLITDLNGGARTDSTTGVINKMMGLFKKGSVFASLSVVVQQPSAIARAAALVNTKYFIGPKVDHKRHKLLWAEVKQYAPVAIIKEMGYFDTNMGKSTQDFILGKEYSGFSEKMKALVTDSGYRDEVLSKAPALADELAWCSIWEAVKREMHDKYPGLDTKSEPFLMLAGSRFTEVVTKTQVYDSVLSRSANMRSKDTGMKMATAFMAEPTTSINMIADALLQGKRGNKKYAGAAIGAVIASQIFNSILVSFVYAGRDDDEDETYWEKYIGSLTGKTLDGLNPLTYIPFIKDAISIFQGYDVERSDMAVISDLWKAIENLKKDTVSPYRKVEGFAGSIAQIFGLPVKNIMREARAFWQTVVQPVIDKNKGIEREKTTKAGIGYAVKSAAPKWMGGGDVSNQQQLYEAILSGDKTQIARVKARYKDEDAASAAIRKALRENDPRIKEAAQAQINGDPSERVRIARLIIADGFSQDDVVRAINTEINSMNSDESSSGTKKEKGFYTASDFAAEIASGDQAAANAAKTDIIRIDQKNGKTAEEAEKSFNNSAKTELKELFLAGQISEQNLISALVNYCGEEQSAAQADVEYWAFKHKYPGVYADDSWFDKYYEEIAESGISIDMYMEYRNDVKDITGDDKKERRMAAIDSLPITSAQKDALYYAEGWAASKISEAPWR